MIPLGDNGAATLLRMVGMVLCLVWCIDFRIEAQGTSGFAESAWRALSLLCALGMVYQIGRWRQQP